MATAAAFIIMERIETNIYNDNTIEHLHRYAFATVFAKGKAVLDIASGEGYGSHLLAGYASKVYGMDIAADIVEKASKKYKKENLQYLHGSADKINLPDNSVDIVVSFETIEHHDKHEEMMQEIKRVLVPDGVLIISTPDKKYYTDIPNHHNPWHVKELYGDEFEHLIKKYFAHASLYAQNITRSSVIMPFVPNNQQTIFCEGDYTQFNMSGSILPLYNIAVASDAPLQSCGLHIFNGSDIYEKNRAWEKENQLKRIEAIKKTYSYRLGYFLLSPLRWIMFSKKKKDSM